jgi:hypothetical protein
MSRLLKHQTEDRLKSIMTDSQAGKREAYRETLQYILVKTQDYCLKYSLDNEMTEVVIATALLLTHELRHTYDPDRSFDRWADAIVEHARNHAKCAQSVGPWWARFRQRAADDRAGHAHSARRRLKAPAIDPGNHGGAHGLEPANQTFHFMEGSL